MGTCATVAIATTNEIPNREVGSNGDFSKLQQQVAVLLNENNELRSKLKDLQVESHTHSKRANTGNETETRADKETSSDKATLTSRQPTVVHASEQQPMELEQQSGADDRCQADSDGVCSTEPANLLERLETELRESRRRVTRLETELRVATVAARIANSSSANFGAKQESRQSSMVSHDSGLDSEADQLARSLSLTPYRSAVEAHNVTNGVAIAVAHTGTTIGNDAIESSNPTGHMTSCSSLTTLSEEAPQAAPASDRNSLSNSLTENQVTATANQNCSPRITRLNLQEESLAQVSSSEAKPTLSARTNSSNTASASAPSPDSSFSSSSNLLSDNEKQTALLSALDIVYDSETSH